SGTVTIPVVFHVVYNTTTENLNNSYLNAQIDQLNLCFARENSDTTNLRSIFQSRAGASKIRFIIDQVIRYQTTMTSFDATTGSGFANADLVKQTGSGGDDAVSPGTKLNIWICDLTKDGSDVLIGYAYPPAGAPNWPAGSEAPSPAFDGVVVDYTDVGGPAKNPIGYSSGFRGKAMVHEVGHYLGLRHIWGDDAGACPGGTGYKDDGINDTPITAENSNFDCNKVKNTCIETTGDLPDMVENYMDYSSESCQNTFTKLQVGAMEYVIDNIRTTVRVPNAIHETEKQQALVSVYPNPATHSLFIDAADKSYQTVQVRIVNTTGQNFLQATYKANGMMPEVDVQHLAPGMYFIELRYDNEASVLRKFIKQ
ncbi:MAG TPA: zinc-dependent metalloprotease, partial [Chitinophagaceae bacterium]|nr:zinc-dependent metalloprotease [Chitinophagaceae bacterium]